MRGLSLRLPDSLRFYAPSVLTMRVFMLSAHKATRPSPPDTVHFPDIVHLVNHVHFPDSGRDRCHGMRTGADVDRSALRPLGTVGGTVGAAGAGLGAGVDGCTFAPGWGGGATLDPVFFAKFFQTFHDILTEVRSTLWPCQKTRALSIGSNPT